MNEKELNERKKRLIENLISIGALKTPKIIEAFRKIPRHEFVPENLIDSAYEDIALPIVKNATISQPYTVAVMTEALEPKIGEKILEIGAGSGWQACILAYCVGEKGKVITMEIDEDVFNFAKRNIEKFGINNIKLILGDGSAGYEREAPFDKIIYTAAVPKIPKIILKQLKVGGRIIAPIGSVFEQTMTVIDKVSENKFEEKYLGSFLFVPLKGKFGFKNIKSLTY
jgi:protein-L-isoaspartate(D-aspartate) O-methyltransferase